MIRFLTAGESHGKALTVIIDGMPPGIPISREYINHELEKRQIGAGSGGRMHIEKDEVEILSGIRFGKTIGSPISMIIWNKDHTNWGEKMSIEEQPSEVVDSATVTAPRPGHADLAGVQKHGFDDVRNVLERASARETAARVAAGGVFKQYLLTKHIEIASHTIQIGDIKVVSTYTFEGIKKTYENDPEIRCVDPGKSRKMKQLIQKAMIDKDTLGGVVETWAVGVPAGCGDYAQWDTKLDGQIAKAMMSIQSVKAVEIGHGIENAAKFGSEVHDEIYYDEKKYYRKTNRAGGIEGGVTNGMPIIVRVYHKPISTLYKPLKTVDIITKKQVEAIIARSDICVIPRAGVVSEAMLAYILARNIAV
ncbi:MAG: Chorismate synthase [Candidatus Roizmanbacteria bacterium GW2011_GWA2_37_7]|uniref:Chorismate synthase n=1 Tax=Candidatus Roizmanbacteria bacterium GW2011_GWA2_37_7 TaxID=1618481 RepID=A0A0G0HFN0_9BACT|nr:MAG: Chorismate synthase [Candidatus Roizmanbacteria bacterium GW2011_GWA2_37_7]